MKTLLHIILGLLISINIYGQEILDNNSIKDLVELGFEEDVIIEKINLTSNNFDTTLDGLKSLKESGVSQNIIKSMLSSNKTIHLEDLNNNEDDFADDIVKYRFNKAYVAGMKIKMRGAFHIGQNNLIMINDATSYSGKIEFKIPLDNKINISENHWKVEYSKMGASGIIEYIPDTIKYNSNGGFIKLRIAGYATIYPLNKVN